jgi:hypothetical protein
MANRTCSEETFQETHVTAPGKKPQVPPLRFAPVGMTILLQGQRFLAGYLLRARQNCHPDRSEAQWRDLRFRLPGTRTHWASPAASKNLREFLRGNHFELRIRTVARLLVGTPAPKLRHVPKAAPLHMLIRNLHH